PGPKSHGSMYHNRPGSGGGSSDPSRVYKGKPNPGHHGDVRVTTRNVVIVKCDPQRNLLFIRGSVPGAPNGYVMIRKRKTAAVK
ncbi:50S ribosomal protein L3, partial [Candidatus Poribacteria bacterium]|nr:50S ribosomal protein L3 [Candidatus Poribacteria bacterium]